MLLDLVANKVLVSCCGIPAGCYVLFSVVLPGCYDCLVDCPTKWGRLCMEPLGTLKNLLEPRVLVLLVSSMCCEYD